MNEIIFNLNGIKLDGIHIHGIYHKNMYSSYEDPNYPKHTIIIELDTNQCIISPGLMSIYENDHTVLIIFPTNRNYKFAFDAWKKSRIREINREIKKLYKLPSSPVQATTINKLEKEIMKLSK